MIHIHSLYIKCYILYKYLGGQVQGIDILILHFSDITSSADQT